MVVSKQWFEFCLESKISYPLPCPSSLCFFRIPCFVPCKVFLVFLSVFPFFSRGLRGSLGIKNPCFSGGFLASFQKQGKEGQGFNLD